MTGGSTSRWLALLGLPVLVYAEVFLRRTLEHADRHLYSFLDYYYGPALPTVFGAYPWWKLLLPIREFTGAWSGAIIITHLVELRIGVPNTWYLFNALLVVVSFGTSWMVFRSIAFSYTFAICMGFGTHFVHTYALSGGMASPLIACGFEILLACTYRFVVSARHGRWWAAAFGASLLMTVLSYEGWLDLSVFMCAAALLFAMVAFHHRAVTSGRRLAAVGATVAVVTIAYMIVKTRLGYGQTNGSESDIVFNYRQWSPLIEDVASNIVTHLYMSVTNFLPPMLTSSTALYEIGGDGLVALQRGYHPAVSYLVPMHYLFLWRYAAGALALGLGLLCVRLVVRVWRRPSRDAMVVIAGLLMMWLAGSTHALVKIRPMKVAPVMSYHVLVGVIGAALLVAYGILIIWRDWRRAMLRVSATAFVWGVVFYGALARPAMLSHLVAQAGLGEGLYPDPMRDLLERLGRTVETPRGMTRYALARRTPALDALLETLRMRPLMANLPGLPVSAPDLTTWAAGRGVTVARADDGYVIEGNAAGGYQLSSPRIPVPPRHRLLVRANGTLERGQVCLGILNEQQRWLLSPRAGVPELSTDTGDNKTISLVFSTCSGPDDSDAPRFRVTSVSYATLMGPDDAAR